MSECVVSGGGAWFVVLNFPPLLRPSLTWLQWLLPGPYEMSDNNDMEVDSYEEQPRFQSAADKQAHDNALERKRRDYIKDRFTVCGTLFHHSKGQQAPWAQILDKATENIQYM